MLKRTGVILALIVLAAAAFGDDFVQTFNTFYRDQVQLSSQDGKWQLKVTSDAATSAEIKVLDLANYYVQFVIVYKPTPPDENDPMSSGDSGGPQEYTFATYPRDGKKDMVAQSSSDSWGFYEPVAGERKDISEDVLPPQVSSKLFDQQYLDDHQDLLSDSPRGLVDRQTEVEGPMMFTYSLTIPRIGTKTVLSIAPTDTNTKDLYPDARELLAALRFHHIDLTWDNKQGVFRIAKVY